MAVRPQESPAAAGAADEPFRRVLLKLSGEALMGPREYGLDSATVSYTHLTLPTTPYV